VLKPFFFAVRVVWQELHHFRQFAQPPCMS
jgi:hypothetical protein